ncbi:MAG: MlaE family ABC transporter permease [Thermodesulfobacteriota bacterium]
MSGLFYSIGAYCISSLLSIGEVSIFFYKCMVATVKPPYDFKIVLEQIFEIGVKSILIVIVSAMAIGMVMVVQLAWGFAWFGAKGLVGPVVTLSFVRELGPVVTSLLVGGRVGSGITAEIGSMNVTEQIDAIKTLGADPLKKLVAPRILAAVISFPLLAVIANLSGIFGAMLISNVDLDIGPKLFLTSTREWVAVSDFLTGISKTIFFGLIVSVTGCYIGMKASGGTQGVGNATTRTVVVSLLLIIICDLVLSKLFVLLVYM